MYILRVVYRYTACVYTLEQKKNMTKTFIVYIEEKLCRGTQIEATDIEEAIEKAREMYRNSEIVLDSNDIGTDTQIMAEAIDQSESTDWSDL